MTATDLAPDVAAQFAPEVEPQVEMCHLGCGRPATHKAKGCMDRLPVAMCGQCLQRGLDLIRKTVNLYQKFNKRVLICGDCYRPILRLDTHLEIREI